MTAAGRAPPIRVRGLRKSYGKQVVLDGIDLDVAEGSVFALLGPNGAGKTTAIQILVDADRRRRRRGRGRRVTTSPASRTPSVSLIGVTGQVSAVDGQFTGEENLRLMADLRHLGRAEGRRRVAGAPRAVRPRRRGRRSPPRPTPAACAAGSTSR